MTVPNGDSSSAHALYCSQLPPAAEERGSRGQVIGAGRALAPRLGDRSLDVVGTKRSQLEQNASVGYRVTVYKISKEQWLGS